MEFIPLLSLAALIAIPLASGLWKLASAISRLSTTVENIEANQATIVEHLEGKDAATKAELVVLVQANSARIDAINRRVELLEYGRLP